MGSKLEKVLGIWFRPGLFAGLNKQKKKVRRNDENDLMGWAPMGLGKRKGKRIAPIAY